MIRVERNKNKIVISGHASFADYGKDIVCASVSSIVTTTINAILSFDTNSIQYEDKNDFLVIEVLKDDMITKTLIKNMISLLKELANDYPKNIKVIA